MILLVKLLFVDSLTLFLLILILLVHSPSSFRVKIVYQIAYLCINLDVKSFLGAH